MGPKFLSEKRGERPMGVYVCELKRIHLVYDFFDVCLCLNGLRRLQENVTNLLTNSDPVAPSYVLRFACASISILAEDLLRLTAILEEAMDKLVLLDIEKELKSSERQVFEPSQFNVN